MSGAAENKSSCSISLKDGNGDPPELDINLPKLCDLPATAKHPSLPIDILLLTVKDCEFLGCHAHLRNSFRWYFDSLGYVYFGNACDDENVKVALMRCNEGSTSTGGSLTTVKNAVTVLRPKAVISVGCCSGLNREKTKLGDVVVSAKLTTYASKEVVDGQEQSIGTRSLVSRRFLQLIRHVADGWKAPLKIPEVRDVTIHNSGEFLSGPEKISADRRRKELVQLHPQATAIEMEGEGLFAAAFDDGIEWLLVKGIADFADGNESSTVTWGSFASVMAASVVFNFLSDPIVLRKWPHYQEEKGNFEDKLGEFDDKLGKVEGNIGYKLGEVEDKLGKVEGNIKDDLEQVKHQVKNLSIKMDDLMETSQDEEDSSDLKRKSDTLTIPPVEKKPGMEDAFDPAELIDGIRQLYKLREGWLTPFPWCEEFHFRLDDLYTRLKMVSRKKTRGTATDHIVNMSDIFKPHEESSQPRTVLIEGKPGMGKTTCCKKLVYDWATGKQEEEGRFPRFETVLLLKCRDITESADLWEAIDDQLLPRDVEEDVKQSFFNFIRHKQSNVLLVLDGLDEVPDSKLPMFSEIIEGRVLQNCRLVATARHEAGIKVRKHCDTLLEIEGFTEEDARTFIMKYFNTLRESGEDLAQKLLYKLRHDENLRGMSANPLNTALLCLVCEEFQGIFPENRTKLYLEIIQCVLRRYIRKKRLSEDSEDLIEVYKTELRHLGWIALNGLLEGNLDFEESELGNHKSDLPGFGFLSFQPGGSKLRPRRHYAFLHKSFQEMFAAFYLCCQLLNKEISPDSVAADRRYYHQLKEVLPFACGMLAARCEETALALIKSITEQVNQDDIDSDDLLEVVLACIKECKKDNSNFHVYLVGVFASFLKNFKIVHLRTGTGIYEVAVFVDALKYNTTVTVLNLTDINMGDDGVEEYTGEHGVAALADALKHNNALARLVLSNNNIGDHGAAALADALKHNNTLARLDLSNNNIGDHGAAALADALKHNNKLAVLFLSNNNIGDHGVAALADALKHNKALARLDLSNNNIGDHGAGALADALKHNNALTHLDLRNNNIVHPGAAALADKRLNFDSDFDSDDDSDDDDDADFE